MGLFLHVRVSLLVCVSGFVTVCMSFSIPLHFYVHVYAFGSAFTYLSLSECVISECVHHLGVWVFLCVCICTCECDVPCMCLYMYNCVHMSVCVCGRLSVCVYPFGSVCLSVYFSLCVFLCASLLLVVSMLVH